MQLVITPSGDIRCLYGETIDLARLGQLEIRRGSFVYTSAAAAAAVRGKIQKKPRGGSRGAVTRSFSGR